MCHGLACVLWVACFVFNVCATVGKKKKTVRYFFVVDCLCGSGCFFLF